MNAFITGSQAYGVPREDSDIDLVVLLGASQLEGLILLAHPGSGSAAAASSASLRFGNLNLICHTKEETFAAWKKATLELIDRKPVTRDEAVATIQAEVKKSKQGEGNGAL